ncbi:hypothetical protein Golob_020163, partial [Gossypium lobatum]|nr:hypothetical protein [Gossypium lobatum]
MQVLVGQLFPFTIFICLMNIIVLPLVSSSSQQHVKSIDSIADKKDGIHKVSHKLMFEIRLHGFLLWASMGFLMPVGILAIRMSNRQEGGTRLKILFYVHILSLLISTAGAVMSVKNFNNSFNNHHQRLGLALYGIIWVQALTGVLRPC